MAQSGANRCGGVLHIARESDGSVAVSTLVALRVCVVASPISSTTSAGTPRKKQIGAEGCRGHRRRNQGLVTGMAQNEIVSPPFRADFKQASRIRWVFTEISGQNGSGVPESANSAKVRNSFVSWAVG